MKIYSENPYHEEAKLIVEQFKQKVMNEHEGFMQDGNLLEELHSFFYNEEEKQLEFGLVESYRDFIVELMTLHTEEDFRQKMKDSYFKKNGGKMLKRLYYLFHLLDSDKVYPYLDYIYLSRFSGAISGEEVKKIKKKYDLE